MCPTWHHPHICMLAIPMLAFSAYTALLSAYLVSLITCFKGHSIWKCWRALLLVLHSQVSSSCAPWLRESHRIYLLMQAFKPRLYPWHSFFLHNYSPNPLYFTCQISSTVCLLFSVSTPSYHGLLLGYESPNWSPSSRHASLPSSKFLCYLLLPILELSLNLSFCPHTHKSLSIMKCCI